MESGYVTGLRDVTAGKLRFGAGSHIALTQHLKFVSPFERDMCITSRTHPGASVVGSDTRRGLRLQEPRNICTIFAAVNSRR